MKSKALFAYALLGYTLGSASFAYIIAFLTDFGVPKTIASGEPAPFLSAVLIDTALVLLFGLHHSVTARTSFKRWWTKFVPPVIERSTYLYMTAAMTAVLVVFWQPLPALLWNVTSPAALFLIYGAFASVIAMMFLATFQFGFFEFYGLAEPWARLRGKAKEQTPPTMTTRYLYAIIRHPISLGWMLLPWLTPQLTVGHVVFAFASLLYILAATPFEESDLIGDLGDAYRDYRTRVPAFIPGFAKRQSAAPATKHAK